MPINVDMTIEGCGGIYPGDMFRLSYLPEIYGQVDYSVRKPAFVKPNDIMPKTYFSVMGLSHTISAEGWDTQITAVTNKSKDAAYEDDTVKDSRDKIRQVYKEKIGSFIRAEETIKPSNPPIGPPPPKSAPSTPPPPPVILEPDDQIRDSIYYDPDEEDSYHRIGDSNTTFRNSKFEPEPPDEGYIQIGRMDEFVLDRGSSGIRKRGGSGGDSSPSSFFRSSRSY